MFRFVKSMFRSPGGGGVQGRKVCFTIPASPNDAFFSQLAMFRRSLDSLGGMYADADLVVVFGDEAVVDIPARWAPHLDRNVKVHWVEPALFREKSYDAQGDRQWELDYGEYDVVCFADADTLLLRPMDELVEGVAAEPAFCGAIAHYPYRVSGGFAGPDDWQALAGEFLGRDIELAFNYSLLPDDPAHKCPFYVNYGLLLTTPALLKRLAPCYFDMRLKVRERLVEHYFSAQVGLALAVAEAGIPVREFDLRYNFPNDSHADAFHADKLADLRVIHYLRTQEFDRHTVFASEGKFREFSGLELSGSNREFQRRVLDVAGGGYPFAEKAE